MSELATQRCEACRADAPRVTEQELSELMHAIPDWQPLVVNGELQLRREFAFRNFKEALAFTNRLGELAEAEFHHPAILTRVGQGDRQLVDPQDRWPAPQRLHHGGAHRRVDEVTAA